MEDFEKMESPTAIQEVYDLLHVRPSESGQLYKSFIAEDQKLFKQPLGAWDYENSDLTINKVKDILEGIDPSSLTDLERKDRSWILWLWNHHATSVAIHLHKDKERALGFIHKALEYQPQKSENKITRLLALLLEDKPDEARAWAESITGIEHTTAQQVLADYPNWFK